MYKVILFLFLVNFSIAGQSSDITAFSDAHLEKVKEDLNYDKTRRALVPRRKAKQKEVTFEPKADKPNQNIGVSGSFVGYLLGGILLAIILYYIVVALNAKRNLPIAEADNDLEDIQEIENQDLDALLLQKLSEKNYRLSFRIQFLKLLQTLAQKNMISWQPNKTNGAYVRECRTGPIKEKFKSISKVFDHIWYGNSEITEEDYLLIKDYVSDLQVKIETIHE